MACIIHQKVGKHTYLYESESYRGSDGKPRCRRKPIGKIDLHTGLPVYKKDYLDRMDARGTPVSVSLPPPTFTVGDIRTSVVKEFGAFYLCSKIADKIGLSGILKNVFTDRWQHIFDLGVLFHFNWRPDDVLRAMA
ncbi:hypothetical protein FACS1894187_24260 [Synergistales bacterium]|nr:hypothetical protein FACS1894187_24260 [Synergistales bacterium]